MAARCVTRAWQLPDVSRATGWLRCFKNQPSNRIINKRLSKESWVRMLPDHTEATSSLAHLASVRCCSQRPLCARKSHGEEVGGSSGANLGLARPIYPGRAPARPSPALQDQGKGRHTAVCCWQQPGAKPMPSPVAATTMKRAGGNLCSLTKPRIQFQKVKGGLIIQHCATILRNRAQLRFSPHLRWCAGKI